ncbi:N-lysine methyltransferase KMT5A-A [Chrysoperla carnea]|uniref:N-lysine methyltransferase KMT5A-A n=1 Tax=Chrysoperla carnea TaxID=189513 RepID=UPI001D0700C3|nr:N-lysine methyltransferase KMT5A-A [Chrysoperla carnea]
MNRSTKQRRAKRNVQNCKNEILSPDTNKKRSKYERVSARSALNLLKSPTIKKYLQMVECITTNKDVEIDLCSKINCVPEYYENHDSEIITDQPCQISDAPRSNTPVTPHRIKLDTQPLIVPKTNKIRKNKLKFDNNTSHLVTEYFPVRRSNRKPNKVVLQEKKRNLQDAINTDVEEGLEIRYFDNKGRGIVTTQPFKRGDFVVEYRGDLIDYIEAKHREQIYARDQNAGCYMYYFKHKNKQYCVDATAESNYLGRLVNHSRNGNLVTKIEDIGGKPHLILIAKDDIDAGQEITYDYGDRSKESLKHHPWLAQ